MSGSVNARLSDSMTAGRGEVREQSAVTVGKEGAGGRVGNYSELVSYLGTGVLSKHSISPHPF